MTLVRCQPKTVVPFRSVNNRDEMTTEMDRLFDWALGNSWIGTRTETLSPAIDVTEHEDHYEVHADLPGLSKADLEITFQDGILTLKGEKKSESEEKKGRSWHRERFHGKFARTLRFGEKVDDAHIEAGFKDGVLEVKLPFRAEAKPKRIDVQIQ